MKRITTALIVGALLVTGALPALAHSFSGTGDCDGWTLKLDGLWGATRIEVDGQSYGTQRTITIPDSSTATRRTFEVRWVKQGPDTVIEKKVRRDLTGCTPTTTTVPETTTTVPETTTTTEVPPSTTLPPSSTSTTLPEEDTTTTTSTVPVDSPTTTVPDTTTSTTPSETTSTTFPAPTTTVTTPQPTVYPDPTDPPPVVQTIPSGETLPETGIESDHLAVAALIALVAGAALIALTPKENTE